MPDQVLILPATATVRDLELEPKDLVFDVQVLSGGRVMMKASQPFRITLNHKSYRSQSSARANQSLNSAG
jgi:hypothetical protein